MMFLNFECGKLKGLRELIRSLNGLYGEVCFDIKCVGSARFPTCLGCMMS